MTIESATYISDLNTAYPEGGSLKSEGDNHMRLLKTVIKATLPNVTGAVTPTHTELNFVDGVTSAIQTQIDGKAALASPTFTGTPAAPTATGGTSSTQIATTAFVATAIALVNAQASATTLSIDTAASITATAGQHIVCTNAATVTVTLPATPSAGQAVWVTVGNGRTDTVIARNGENIMSLAEDLTANDANVTVALRYINSTLGWRIV